MVSRQGFFFLNQYGAVESAADWNAGDREKLWLYNVHYFDDLNAAGSATRAQWHRALIARWIDENPVGYGNGWEPYPLSLRIVNWIKWALAGNAVDAPMAQSLADQARYLRSRLEWHLLGNHLFANAKSLVFAGCYFAGEEAESWRQKGLEILAREVPEQILADGGHFELSPMYHSLVEEDLLDLVNLAHAYPGVLPQAYLASWMAVSQRMQSWLTTMLHPDGEIAFFNDAAFGVSPEPRELEAYAQRLGLSPSQTPRDGLIHLPESGYIRLQQGNVVALLDVARIGPDYLPGHAHADTLTFELSLAGQRVIVNSGTSLYESGNERHRQRSTAAHNTVVVDDENSSEVWGAFRVARRAHPIELSLTQRGDQLRVCCAHDGYRHRPGRVTHRREWRCGPLGFSVADQLEGRFSTALSYLYFHPAVSVLPDAKLLDSRSGCHFSYRVRDGNPTLIDYTYHPEFGLSIPGHGLKIVLSETPCVVTFSRPSDA